MEPYIFDKEALSNQKNELLTCLDEFGFVVIKGLFSSELLDQFNKKVNWFLSAPAIAGALGYTKLDHPKKVVNPFLVGKQAMEMSLNEDVINLVEEYINSECILAETIIKYDKGLNYEYFAIHSDLMEGKIKGFGPYLSQKDLESPVAVGGCVYLHDSTEGAFCFCKGTHKLGAHRGKVPENYPQDEKEQILSQKIRIEGERGDLVLFDDRGFHGPDHPSRVDRTVLLLDYYSVKKLGYQNVYPHLVSINDLGGLSEKQQYVLGIGADSMIPLEQSHTQRITKYPVYKLIVKLVENASLLTYLKMKYLSNVKTFIKRKLTKSTPSTN